MIMCLLENTKYARMFELGFALKEGLALVYGLNLNDKAAVLLSDSPAMCVLIGCIFVVSLLYSFKPPCNGSHSGE